MKKLIFAVMMVITITAAATIKEAWPTTSGKLPAWPVVESSIVKLPTELTPTTDGKVSSKSKLPYWPSEKVFSVEEPDTTDYGPYEK